MPRQNTAVATSASQRSQAQSYLSPNRRRADGPFDNMRGSWSGGGTITLSNGAQARIRCRASYTPRGPNLRMSLVCASDSYKVDLTSQITSSGGEIKGTWAEAENLEVRQGSGMN